ncbi:DUF6083 domain-containing protein [Kitasatospora sp. NBC_01539]|uniref:DUF6083 domain-containing protein n=1 Tax=Kitasatospora sp. NBC_01539 TaxID=2903577 RepID=UPI00386015E3
MVLRLVLDGAMAQVRAAAAGRRADDAVEGRRAVCASCGAAARWHRTVHGRWMLVEPGDHPTLLVPPGHRWRIAGDGTVVNLRAAAPSDHCRIRHPDVCPAGPVPRDPYLRSVRSRSTRSLGA